ncbi:hypothetical protein SERLADRAFT_433783 [Serpula lacrymans var. lacrymans S7.9]|uniref:Alpha-type protein kinase domain-containing protein n=1 Tax=Serpula lacrymans var. lacrymans (strain S7.9) TaxID=578457 RepID=F8NJC7_SERL9|nr:uncharacterized protein SERLADRAFT_433783 [Serpula lacrymans var. lacrymans S7.9]EGO29825.1 hypothetical protein SERLADRAFT_433783 [Serpula lacrymans var. lacrymans S7.9]
MPYLNTERLVLHNFFYRVSGTNPIPKLQSNVKVTIILVMTNTQFEDILNWKEECSRVVKTGGHGSVRDDGSDSSVFQLATMLKSKCVTRRKRGSSSPSSSRASASTLSCQITPAEHRRSLSHICKPSTTTSFFGSIVPPAAGNQSTSLTLAQSNIADSGSPFNNDANLSNDSNFDLPDRNLLHLVMKAQEVNDDAAVYTIVPVPSMPFLELLQAQKSFKVGRKDEYTSVLLTVDRSTKSMVAPAGTFKTCHPTSISRTADSLTTNVNNIPLLQAKAIVAKQCFYREVASNNSALGRRHLALSDELEKSLVECNCLYWATSLMDYTYSFINNVLAHQDSNPEAPPIPRLHVVRCGLALPRSSSDPNTATFIIEERIFGKFVKYINNNCATPRHGLLEEEHLIATFLCCVQHIQYMVSLGLVFLSDFQGAGSFLTDCQSVLRVLAMDTLENFPTLHKCNRFCAFLGLKPLLHDDSPYSVGTSFAAASLL